MRSALKPHCHTVCRLTKPSWSTSTGPTTSVTSYFHVSAKDENSASKYSISPSLSKMSAGTWHESTFAKSATSLANWRDGWACKSSTIASGASGAVLVMTYP